MLLGVTGGIAAYKACEIARGLADQGIAVQVVLTPNAAKFVTPLTFASLTARPAWTDEFPPGAGTLRTELDPISHISLAQQADLLLIAPATANTIAKLAHGIADNLLSSMALAWHGPCIIAPAMNSRMYEHPATQRNLQLLSERGLTIIEPEEGWLACGETGRGRLASTPRILVEVLRTLAAQAGPLAGKRILVTAGGTREPLDPVRFISNGSTGTLALKCAASLLLLGAEIELICAPGCDRELLGRLPVTPVFVTTAAEMKVAVEGRIGDCDALLMLAAVADFTTAPSGHKLKKDEHEQLELKLKRTADILSALAERKDLVKVGVSLETDDALNRARGKLSAKALDAIVAVDYRPGDEIYGESDLLAGILTTDGDHLALRERSKNELAGEIASLICILLGKRSNSDEAT